jgi:hypothetical protein
VQSADAIRRGVAMTRSNLICVIFFVELSRISTDVQPRSNTNMISSNLTLDVKRVEGRMMLMDKQACNAGETTQKSHSRPHFAQRNFRLWFVVLVPCCWLAVACGAKAPAKAPDVSSDTTAKEGSTPEVKDEAASSDAKPKTSSPKTYAKSRWSIGNVNLSDAASAEEGENESLSVIDGAATKLGLTQERSGGSMSCDYRRRAIEFKKGKLVYELGWSYPAPADEVVECEADEVRPENEQISAASIREVDAPAGLVLWVKTDNGDTSTAKKLFDAVFKKN